MKRKRMDSYPFPYHIVTPILLGVFFFWEDLQFVMQLLTGELPIGRYIQRLDRFTMVLLWLGILSIVFVYIGMQVYYRWRAKKEWRVIQVIPSTAIQITANQVHDFVLELHKRHRTRWMRLLRGREWYM